eukprot:COSAG04_NODE_34_length_34523_cov_40.302446_3_plen_158_part_00
MTVPFVDGLQRHPDSDKYLLTTAMLKDFVVYNLESNQPVGGSDWQERLRYNAVVSEADLRQTFLPAFEAGARGGVRSMMTSYHALNGIPTSAHPIIQTELRERLGWEGMMMSDGGAISYMLNFKCAFCSFAQQFHVRASSEATVCLMCISTAPTLCS